MIVTVLDVLAQVGIQVAIWSSLLAMITYATLNAVIVPFAFVYSSGGVAAQRRRVPYYPSCALASPR